MYTDFLEKCPRVLDQPFIIFLGRIHIKKGIEHLIEAYANMIAVIQELNNLSAGSSPLPKLVIAGPGLETPYGKKMQQWVSSSDALKDSVFFPGMLSGHSKWGALYRSEAFILPSHQENFGIAVVEALACGKPVLISNQVNIWPEIMEAGGGMVEDDTTKGTQNLLERWQQLTKDEKTAMGGHAQVAYQNNFSIIPVARRFYQKVLVRQSTVPTDVI